MLTLRSLLCSSGAAVPRLQPPLPQSARARRLLPHRLTPRQGQLTNLDSSRNPKLVSIYIFFFFDPKIHEPEQDTPSPARPVTNCLLEIWLQALAGPKLHPHDCLDQDVYQSRRTLSCLFDPGCSSGITGEVQKTRRCPNAKRSSREIWGQKVVLFCQSSEAADLRSPCWDGTAS